MTFFGCPTDINTSTVAVLKSHYTFAFWCGRITRHRKKRFWCIACCLIWLVILKSSWSLHIGLWDVRWKFKGWNRETYLSLSQERKGSRCSFSERKESLIVFILFIASSQVDALIHKQTQWQTTDSSRRFRIIIMMNMLVNTNNLPNSTPLWSSFSVHYLSACGNSIYKKNVICL